ncbi:MAG: mammalian cell entry protein [Frankiales bacterium]|nr:mammalian cell entry protein [Frankiales bacterium]
MAAPLRKGRALVNQRLSGVAFLLVLALLVWLSVALYNKDFTDTVNVSLKTDRVGNQLTVHADVKVRGVVVGEVRKVTSDGDHAVLKLALKPGQVGRIPRDVQAQLLPKTLFGEKEVDLVVPASASADHIRNGDTIEQDRSTTARETETALNDLLPLLRALKPQQLSITLNALATALRGRGDQLGANAVRQAAYLRTFNRSLPTLQQDMQGLADVANTYADATPTLLRTLDNLSFSSRSVVDQKAQLDTFLRSTADFAATATAITAQNEQRFVDLARLSRPVLDLYEKYSPIYACTLGSIVVQQVEVERTEGGLQGGLHITVEPIKDRNGGYVPGDEPKYKEVRDNKCFGLRGQRIRPYPNYANPQDGYRDSAPPEDPGQGPGGCCQSIIAQLESAPRPVARRSLPTGTTPLELLLLAPATGSSS